MTFEEITEQQKEALINLRVVIRQVTPEVSKTQSERERKALQKLITAFTGEKIQLTGEQANRLLGF